MSLTLYRGRETRSKSRTAGSRWVSAAMLGSIVALGAACSTDTQPKVSYLGPRPFEAVGGAAEGDANVAHEEVFLAASGYPSAKACQPCHPKQYEEWAVSPHSYAQMSPVFNAMHGTVVKLTNGSNGDFCIRCHAPVGMALEEPLFTSNLERHETSREGITCIVCHRVDKAYGKISGRLDLVKGDLLADIFGPSDNSNLRAALDDERFDLTASDAKPGRRTHGEVKQFFQLNDSSFCGACHDVTLNGFRLEEAFSEYKASPAAKAGTSCQDCHMATIPGVKSDYEHGPAARVAGVPTKDRKLTNHMFVGPDYSVIHPGIFPHSVEASGFATLREWLDFDHEAGWGTDEFERNASSETVFPERWAEAESRRDARKILDKQEALLARADRDRRTILANGYQLGDMTVFESSPSGIRFSVNVKNGTDGHGVPTGFIAERVVWVRVTVRDSSGKVVFESGDFDPNGDIRDSHSLYVHAGELPIDDQLFSLQSKFITTNVRGSEREQVLAVNYSASALPFVRPPTRSNILTGRPGGARIHKVNIMPNDSRTPIYTVSPERLAGSSGPYRATVELVAGMVPVNLVAEISGVGFDYGMSAKEIAKKVVDGHLTLWEFDDVELVSGRTYPPARTASDSN